MVQSRLWGAGSGVILRVTNMVVMGGNTLTGGRMSTQEKRERWLAAVQAMDKEEGPRDLFKQAMLAQLEEPGMWMFRWEKNDETIVRVTQDEDTEATEAEPMA